MYVYVAMQSLLTCLEIKTLYYDQFLVKDEDAHIS